MSYFGTKVRRSDPRIKAVLSATFPEYRGRLITVEEYRKPTTWSVFWDEGSRDVVKLIDLTRGIADLPVVGAPWTNPEGTQLTVDQPPNSLLVVHSIVCGRDRGITIIARGNDRGLPAPIAGMLRGAQEDPA